MSKEGRERPQRYHEAGRRALDGGAPRSSTQTPGYGKTAEEAHQRLVKVQAADQDGDPVLGRGPTLLASAGEWLAKGMVQFLEAGLSAPSVRTAERLITALPGLPPQVVAELRLNAVICENWRQRPDVPWNRRRN